jgi:hypothetical protein
MPVATAAACSLGKRFDLRLSKMLALPPILVFRLAWGNSSEKALWRRIGDEPEIGSFAHLGVCNSSENAVFRKSFGDRLFISLPLLRIGNYIL